MCGFVCMHAGAYVYICVHYTHMSAYVLCVYVRVNWVYIVCMVCVMSVHVFSVGIGYICGVYVSTLCVCVREKEGPRLASGWDGLGQVWYLSK